MRSLKALGAKAEKILPILIGSTPAPTTSKIVNDLRINLPHNFFNLIKKMSKMRQNTERAEKFRSVLDYYGDYVEQPSLSEYIKSLYWQEDEPTTLSMIPSKPREHRWDVNEEVLECAIRKLSRNKA